MKTTVKWTPSVKKLWEELKRDPLNKVGESRAFNRDDGHVLMLVSVGHNPTGAASFRRGQRESTRFAGFHVVTLEWSSTTADAYRVCLVSDGDEAFDEMLHLHEVHENILNWYGGDAAFDGRI